MGRLTEKDDSGNWRLKGLTWKELYAGATLTRQAQGRIYGALHRLLDYEETGLSPEEVEEMRENFIPPEEKEATDRVYADMCRELDACWKKLKE